MLPLLGEWHGEGQAAGAAGDHRFGQWIRFSHDGRGFLAYESRTWRLTDDGAIVGPGVRESGFWRPRGQDDVELLVTSPDGLVEIYVGTRADDDQLGADHRRPGPHPRRPRRHARRAALRDRRRRADVRHRPRGAGRAARGPGCPPDSNGSDEPPSDPPATPRRSPTATSTPSATSTRSSPPRSAPARATTGCPTSARPGWRRRRRWPASTLAELDRVLAADPALVDDPIERRCARLLRERLGAELAAHEAGEGLPDAVQPVQPGALGPPGLLHDADGDRGGLGRHRPPDGAGAGGLPGLPRDASRRAPGAGCSSPRARCAPSSASSTSGWPGRTSPRSSRPAPRRCAPSWTRPRGAADGAVAEIRDYLRDEYAPAGRGDAGRRRPRAVRRRRPPLDRLRPRRGQRARGGLRLGLGRAPADPRRAADRGGARCCPGATPMEAMRWLDAHGPAVEGVEAIRERLQAMMDDAIAALDGTHFDLAEPVRRVEAMIAPPGSAAAPYYTRPAQDFSRPGRTWLPTLGRDPLPALGPGLDLVPRGRPGPSPAAGAVGLRLGAAVDVPDVAGLGRRQRRGLGAVRRAADGRARLLHRPRPSGWATSTRSSCGRCGWSSTSACTWGCRSRTTPRASLAEHRGQPWTPELARAFLGENSGADLAFLDSELVRYLGIPGQAISYKLGERAWLEGRAAAQQAPGRGLRPQGLAHGGAVAGLARPRRPRRGARAALAAEPVAAVLRDAGSTASADPVDARSAGRRPPPARRRRAARRCRRALPPT